MKGEFAAVLVMGALVTAAPALADEREFSDVELAACVALEEAKQIVLDARHTEKVWIDDLRPDADTERERIALNEYVAAFNSLNDVVGKFDDAWNANCKGSLRYSTYEAVCKKRTGRMARFLKDGDGCKGWAEVFDE